MKHCKFFLIFLSFFTAINAYSYRFIDNLEAVKEANIQEQKYRNFYNDWNKFFANLFRGSKNWLVIPNIYNAEYNYAGKNADAVNFLHLQFSQHMNELSLAFEDSFIYSGKLGKNQKNIQKNGIIKSKLHLKDAEYEKFEQETEFYVDNFVESKISLRNLDYKPEDADYRVFSEGLESHITYPYLEIANDIFPFQGIFHIGQTLFTNKYNSVSIASTTIKLLNDEKGTTNIFIEPISIVIPHRLHLSADNFTFSRKLEGGKKFDIQAFTSSYIINNLDLYSKFDNKTISTFFKQIALTKTLAENNGNYNLTYGANIIPTTDLLRMFFDISDLRITNIQYDLNLKNLSPDFLTRYYDFHEESRLFNPDDFEDSETEEFALKLKDYKISALVYVRDLLTYLSENPAHFNLILDIAGINNAVQFMFNIELNNNLSEKELRYFVDRDTEKMTELAQKKITLTGDIFISKEIFQNHPLLKKEILLLADNKLSEKDGKYIIHFEHKKAVLPKKVNNLKIQEYLQ
ncbi:MAG: hypothetical protein IJ566_07990 [Cardiobacteriaceae bacterium]|nr:hypothetical protein [Cardiobacteriaceae bacterium]